MKNAWWRPCRHGEELRKRLNKHRYNAKNRPDKIELDAHMHTYQHKVLILKGNLLQKYEREL